MVSFIFRSHYSLPKNASCILHKRIRGHERRSRCGGQYRPYPCRNKDAGSWIRSQSPGKPQTQACGILKYPVTRQNVCCGFRQCIAGLHLKTASQKHRRASFVESTLLRTYFAATYRSSSRSNRKIRVGFRNGIIFFAQLLLNPIYTGKVNLYFTFTKCIKI